jgi:ABC-2 type transport system permease protein
MLRSVFAKTLRDSRLGIILWGVGMGSIGLLVAVLYPTLQANVESFMSYVEALPDWFLTLFGGGDLSTLGGMVEVYFLSMLPLMLAAATIAAGSGAFQGEEDKHTLDLLMSQPVRRWRVAAEKFAAITVATLLATLITSVLFVAGLLIASVETDILTALLAPFNAVPLALAVGALAMLGSAFLPTRGATIAVAAAVLAASYFLQVLGEIAPDLSGVRQLSLYYYYAASKPMAGVMEWGHVALLLVLTGVLFLASTWAFERRELRI